MKKVQRNLFNISMLLSVFLVFNGCDDAKKEECEKDRTTLDGAIDTFNASRTKTNCTAVLTAFDNFLKNKNDCADKDSYQNSYEAFVTANKNCQ
jgi:hypothetical protein